VASIVTRVYSTVNWHEGKRCISVYLLSAACYLPLVQFDRQANSEYAYGSTLDCIRFLTGEPMAIADTLLDPIVRDDIRGDKDVREAPLYRILIHNDDVTPFDYVIRTLKRIFMLSQELAEHIAETAHDEQVAIVMIRPRPEAEKLIGIARTHARADGYPLTFSMEPD